MNSLELPNSGLDRNERDNPAASFEQKKLFLQAGGLNQGFRGRKVAGLLFILKTGYFVRSIAERLVG